MKTPAEHAAKWERIAAADAEAARTDRVCGTVKAAGVEYLTRIPGPGTIPPGQAAVHNHVRPPARKLGTRGFRAWLAGASDPALIGCDCGWAPELGGHYRIRGAGQPGAGDAPTAEAADHAAAEAYAAGGGETG